MGKRLNRFAAPAEAHDFGGKVVAVPYYKGRSSYEFLKLYLVLERTRTDRRMKSLRGGEGEASCRNAQRPLRL